MQIITRAESRARGLKHYRDATPCQNGHDSERLVSNGSCVECMRVWRAENAAKRREYGRAYREERREHIAEYRQAYYQENRETLLENKRKNRDRTRAQATARQRQRRQEDPTKTKEQQRRYIAANRERVNAWRRANLKRPEVKTAAALRSLIHRTVTKKSAPSERLIGYTPDELRLHIERQFLPGMSWDNHGTAWHIDHIYPVAQFIRDGETDPAVINCLSNLRPMWADENRAKGDKVETLL